MADHMATLYSVWGQRDGLSNDLEITPERELVALEERPRLHHGAEVDADRDALHVGPGEHPDMMSALKVGSWKSERRNGGFLKFLISSKCGEGGGVKKSKKLVDVINGCSPGAQLAVRDPRDEREAVPPGGERVEVRLWGRWWYWWLVTIDDVQSGQYSREQFCARVHTARLAEEIGGCDK